MAKYRAAFYHIILYFTAAVWFVNGLLCKVLNLVPRHRQIVSVLLGADIATFATKTIGIAEIFMAVWIVTGFRSRLCAVTQVTVIMTMNIIEFLYAPQLLLFGRFNLIAAILFCCLILFNEYATTTARQP